MYRAVVGVGAGLLRREAVTSARRELTRIEGIARRRVRDSIVVGERHRLADLDAEVLGREGKFVDRHRVG